MYYKVGIATWAVAIKDVQDNVYVLKGWMRGAHAYTPSEFLNSLLTGSFYAQTPLMLYSISRFHVLKQRFYRVFKQGKGGA